MPLRQLFLSHYSGDWDEVHHLATELRVRGIPPWVDKRGGFKVADHSPTEARRAIRHDCFGLLLYATPDVFNREFIRDVEVDEAQKVHADDPGFLLFAVPRRITFDDLSLKSVPAFGLDLSRYHTIRVDDDDTASSLAEVADAVLTRVVSSRDPAATRVSVQFSTRELLPDGDDDLLRLDATALASAIGTQEPWRTMLRGLRDVKSRISTHFGRPVLYVHGSKHLSSAFAFGRVFAAFDLNIQQTPTAIWKTGAARLDDRPLAVSRIIGDSSSPRLFIEIAARHKNVGEGVSAYVSASGTVPGLRLQFRPPTDPFDVDNGSCLAMVQQVYDETERTMRQCSTDEVHIFAAVPQAFMMMLGRVFRGMPDTYLYEWTGTTYHLAGRVEAGVL